MDSFSSISGKLLVSLRSMRGDYFNKTVTLIIEHNEDGAFGLVVNRPIDADLSELLVNQKEFDSSPEVIREIPLLETGPVEQNRLFFLHGNDREFSYAKKINDHVSCSTSSELLTSILKGDGPADVIAGLGYAGWSAGQLENEIKGDVWLVTPYVQEAVFKTPFEERPQIAAGAIGIELSLVAPTLGHG